MIAVKGAAVLEDGGLSSGLALLCDNGNVTSVASIADIPLGAEIIDLKGGIIAPGLVDLQVNGGGGFLLNNAIDAQSVLAIAAAHAASGSPYILPTLISDDAQAYPRAVDAVEAAIKINPRILGVHLEGPHFSSDKRGVHAESALRDMSKADVEFLCSVAQRMRLLVTLAPERVRQDQIEQLADAGVLVSLGHSQASFTKAEMAFGAGARSVTHLFNAMSGVTAREPGLTGAALTNPDVYCGLIADGHHVHAATIRLAMNSKPPGKLYLVSDAMATAASDVEEMSLYGETISVQDGRLVSAEGKLAGSHATLADCVTYCANGVGVAIEVALRMASLYPAQLLGVPELFEIRSSSLAGLIHVETDPQNTDAIVAIRPLVEKLQSGSSSPKAASGLRKDAS